ncbi:TonB-dependent receptor [Rheinheimera muenzenbergensis]|uniref:TonB-dependent receptor n=1 Tax=Rheinheimera muenzenbergensis TaxID=1193628 RepID=A0ABU8C4M6_9GAMM
MEKISIKTTLLTQSLMLALAGASIQLQAEEDKEQSARKSIEVIVVTGEKIQRSIKDTAASVAVINQALLESGQLASMSDALADISNLVVLTGAVPDIRGVSGNGSATGFNSFTGGARARVSSLVDGVAQPFVADLTGDTGLWDIEQVEVFRGPQSTSNGRNSIGGAVYISSKNPVMDWEGAVRLGYRNQHNFFDSAAVLSGPIIDDELAFRIASQWIDGETYSNPINYPANPAQKSYNELDTSNTRAKLLWTPKQFADLAVLFSYQHYQEEGNAGRLYFDAKDPAAHQPVQQRYLTTRADTSSVKLDYQLSPQFSLQTLVAYMDYQWGAAGYEATAAAESDVLMQQTELTFDTKLNYGTAASEYAGFIGLAYFKRRQDFQSVGATHYFGDDASDSKAVYAENRLRLDDNWSITTGVRIEREQQQRDFSMLMRGAWVNAQLEQGKTFTLPKLVLQYQLADHTTLSISARQGYNAGGGAFNGMTTAYYYYDSEQVNTYELSSRSVLQSGNTSISVNVFYNDFSDYQALSSTRTITNIEQAHSYGLELEAYTMLGNDWQLHSSLGLLESKIDKAAAGFEQAVGNELNSAPSVTACLGLSYWLTEQWKLDISSNYVGEFYGDLNNTAERSAGDYVLTRASVNYSADSWMLSAYVNNAFDEAGMTTRDPASPAYPNGYVAMVNPRTLGASVTYRF